VPSTVVRRVVIGVVGGHSAMVSETGLGTHGKTRCAMAMDAALLEGRRQ
jgi:hypothetical protein